MKKYILSLLFLAVLATVSLSAQAQKMELKSNQSQYATYELRADLGMLNDRDKELIDIFIQISEIMDKLFWQQSFGIDYQKKLQEIKDPSLRRLANIHYGAWDRLNGNKPFLPGYGNKPAGAYFYPEDMTNEEFEKIKDPLKTSPYTVIQRSPKGSLNVVPYHIAYKPEIEQVCDLLEKAIPMTENEGMRKYLELRREALRSDDYTESDMAWMDMKDSRLDFVFGPIENYEDGLFGYKTAYEAFVLVKDEEWSSRLEHFTEMLPELQQKLPCDDKYKKEKPGTNNEINVYDVIYYAGNCNAGGKTIAVNLPNDEKIQLERGTRRLQLKNAMQAKYDAILTPIAKEMISPKQLDHVNFDAFFDNVCFHEVAHGLGIKNTITGNGSVRNALQNQYSAWEEAKADICGLFLVQTLIERGDIPEISVEDAYVTFLASILRSVRFGIAEAHGIANIMCFNYMKNNGAFIRDNQGKYLVNVDKMQKAINEWAALILKTQGDGNYKFAESYAAKNGTMQPELAKDLKRLDRAQIPIDLTFKQGQRYLDVKTSKETKLPTFMDNKIDPFKTDKK